MLGSLPDSHLYLYIIQHIPCSYARLVLLMSNASIGTAYRKRLCKYFILAFVCSGTCSHVCVCSHEYCQN